MLDREAGATQQGRPYDQRRVDKAQRSLQRRDPVPQL